MKKLLALILTGLSFSALADVSGIYLGGGIGYGSQKNDYSSLSTTNGTPALRLQVGYQFASWIDAELGWNYITQTGNWQNFGNTSSTIYDLSFTPGFTIPATPVTIFARLGINSLSTNLNSSWYNQVVSNSSANFEYGLGVKVAIPLSNTFVRAEYINYGAAPNNGNSNLTTTVSSVLITAAYVF